MSSNTEDVRTSVRAALDAARVVFGPATTATAPELWATAQQLLQQVVGRPELTGQALVGEARRLGHITLSDAHALVALSSWADRTSGPATDEAERLIVRESWMALDHGTSAVLNRVADDVPRMVPNVPFNAPFSPPSHAPANTSSPAAGNTSAGSSAGAPAGAPMNTPITPTAPRARKFLLLGGAIGLLALFGSVGWWYWNGRAERTLQSGIAAYQRGARESARTAFVEAAQLDAGDARPLIYLGRITREEGDLARARRFLTNAVRLDPASALAARELAAVMLADGQPEIARRFYVRAIELDPADRSAQGFLACALFRLQRYDEARRWMERAGPGEWQGCTVGMLPGAPVGPPGPTGLPPMPPR